MEMLSGKVFNSFAAWDLTRSNILLQASKTAIPLRSAVALAAEGDVLAMR